MIRLVVAFLFSLSAALTAHAVSADQPPAATQPPFPTGQPMPHPPCFTLLHLGEVKPEGWLKEQMLRDLQQGFAGHLDQLAKEVSSDIFVSGRNRPNASGAIDGEPHWWNGESEGNWRAGFIMMAYLSGDPGAIRRADAYVQHILSSQDADGYMGINSPELRYTEAGELWTETCLFRGLLDDAELTGNQDVFKAVKRAVDHTLDVLGPNKKSVLWDEHDLMFNDVLERLYAATGDSRYPAFGLWLYEDYNRKRSDRDGSLTQALDLGAPLTGHAVRNYEMMRIPMWLDCVFGRNDLGQAWRNSMAKVQRYTFPGGAAVGEEAVENLPPDPTYCEFEYCDVKELQADFESALQKSGLSFYGDKTEQLFFNDTQGARLADGSAISYLTSENRLRLDGKKLVAPDKPEPRNKYSPTQADVAVCCNPNATQVAAYYVGGMWMRQGADTLAALLYGPCTLSTQVGGAPVTIEEKTAYPFRNDVDLTLSPRQPAEFTLLLRDPAWSRGTRVACSGADITREGSYWKVRKRWTAGDTVHLQFAPTVHEVDAVNGEVALQYGALLFARDVPSQEVPTKKTYPVPGFKDSYYLPVADESPLAFPAATRWNAFGFQPRELQDGADLDKPFDAPVVELQGEMIQPANGGKIAVTVVPLGNADKLRRVTFPIYP